MEDERYFFDSLRETSDSPKKAKKMKEGNASYWHLVFISCCFSMFMIEILLRRQHSKRALPGDV